MADAAPSASPDAAAGLSSRRQWIVFAAGLALIVAAVFLAVAGVARGRAIEAAQARARDASTLAIAILRAELEKQRALPLILARDPDVAAALAGGDVHALDVKLADIARETRSAVIYLLDARGTAIAASNWNESTSFVGSDYAFRDYFIAAVADGAAEQFALGTVSHRPGLYITRRVEVPGARPGVIVVKVEFDRVEADWRALGGQTYVADARGVVLLATEPSWRFAVEAALPPEAVADIRRSLQFGDAPLTPLPLEADGDLLQGRPPFGGTHVSLRTPVPTTAWHLDVLLPVGRAIGLAQAQMQGYAALLLMPGGALAALVLWRRQRAVARRRGEERIKAELEQRVAERTAALADSNARLVAEITERARTQERLSDVREELAKANRLATLGQVTAGVAHEINQPLAAIRTYAENARAFLTRREAGGAEGALDKVVALTGRIGAITETLRGFARRGNAPPEPVALAEAIEGALMILDAPLRQSAIVPVVDRVPPELRVLARPVELEQVLVNLLRNAIEAIGPDPREGDDPPLAIGLAVAPESVALTVRDRGPGLDADELAALFTPFRSTKPRGLGLGLVISHDLVAGFGGTLKADGHPGEGCRFTVTLRRAA
ncbi:sensor histidine kinase [Ancylobacter terrae]|uniref:sensor histidine kinase n=1 Tax=Ancylobacter sp. sgz301288 TaxID=3342077 RepID=UPI003860040A